MKYTFKNEAEWLATRLKYITATESATLLGLNPYSSPYKMWNEKMSKTFSGNSYTRIGQLLEPVVVAVTNEVLNRKFKLYHKTDKIFYTNDEYKIAATPDAHENHNILLECKTTRPHSFLKYKDKPPIQYLMQIQTQMFCTGIRKSYLSILSTDLTQKTEKLEWPIAIYSVEYCDTIIELLKQELNRFWSTVEKGDSFRVMTEVKQAAMAAIQNCYTKINIEELE